MNSARERWHSWSARRLPALPDRGGKVLRLRDIMTTDVTVLRPETPIRDAMAILASSHISGAPVVSGHRVLGVVSATDLMLFAAELPGLPADQPQALQEDVEVPDDVIEGNDPAGAFFHEIDRKAH